jgi:endo-1,4-beta-xylanase
VLKAQFSQMTAGNIMKMSYLHPTLNGYNWTQADDFIQFATDNNIKIHAHTLIWHSDYQVPDFMTAVKFTGDKVAYLDMLKTHVQTIVTHFAGKVSSWDVVNEALVDGGGYRNSVFYQKTGTDYIEQAFVNARAADPTADLYYNDYNIEVDAAKLKTLTTMVDDFKLRGIPITGVGFQMHVYMDYPSASTIQASLKQIADRGLKVKISELDIPINNIYSAAYKAGDVKTTLTPALALAQKKRYCEVVTAYMNAVPPAQRGGIVVWGVSDPSSWLITDPNKPDWPLLYDASYAPKPAWQGVADGLTGAACTNL